jgi:hypothetical protein
MKIEGVKKLLNQLSDLPDEAHLSLKKSIERTVKSGATKARAVAPDVTGDFKSGISSHVMSKPDYIAGFINFYDGTADDGLAANAINYGWGNNEYGYHVREYTKMVIQKRHDRAVKRQLKKAIKDVMNG